MANTVALPRNVLIYAIILPLAAVIGYLLASPQDFDSMVLVGLVFGTLLIPVLMRWHHPLLVVGWNASINLFFLPGQPSLWMGLAILSLGVSVLDQLLSKRRTFVYVPSLVWPLLLLLFVVVVTAKLTGGVGFRALGGGTFGGKRYFYILLALVGFFALASQRIPSSKANTYIALFFLSSLTAMVSNLIYLFPNFYFLYYLFPAEMAYGQAMADYSLQSTVLRLTGIAIGGPSICYFILCRYGVRGLLAPGKLWRLLLFLGVIFVTMLGGFRSSPVMMLLLCSILFLFEGLHRTRLLPAIVLILVCLGVFLFTMAERLPISVQRSLSFLPIRVDPIAKLDAQSTTEWRLTMWKILWPEVPRYLLLGKGYGMNPTDLYLYSEAVKRGQASDIEATIVSGSFHSGPLTLVIPLGIFGVIAFLWFAGASLIFLYRHYRTSAPELRMLNIFLLSYFAMRLIYFLLFYGQFADDLYVFTGIVGLSLSINGRVKNEAETPARLPAESPA